MKDQNGRIIAEEEFMKGIGHSVHLPQDISQNLQKTDISNTTYKKK